MKKYKNFLLLSATLLTSLSAPLAAANEQFSPSQLTAMTSEVSVQLEGCLLYTSPSPRDLSTSRMPSSA